MGIDSCAPHQTFGIFKSLNQALCAADISAIIYGFARIASFIEISLVHCVHTLEVKDLCGSGIAGLVASAAGLSRDGAVLYAACNAGVKLEPLQHLIAKSKGHQAAKRQIDEFEEEVEAAEMVGEGPDRRLNEGERLPSHLDAVTASWARHGFNVSYAEARRLVGLEAPAADQTDPREIWKGMGYDLSDPDMPRAKGLPEESGNPEAFLRVMQSFLGEVGEDTADLDGKWPLWPSPFEQDP